MSRTFIVNASPLILLARVQRLDLLNCLAETVVVPAAVMREVEAGGDRDHASERVRSASDLHLVEDLKVPTQVALWDLGAGESQVLARALATTGTEAILDDRAARRCARALGIPSLGTLGVVVKCRDRGLIPAARPLVERLQDEGMRLKRTLLDAVLATVGE